MFFFDLCFDDHSSFVIFRSASVRPRYLFDQNFDHDYFFELPLTRERDALSSARCSTSHHVRYRAVPRTNRTPAPSSRAYQPKTARVERSRHCYAIKWFFPATTPPIPSAFLGTLYPVGWGARCHGFNEQCGVTRVGHKWNMDTTYSS